MSSVCQDCIATNKIWSPCRTLLSNVAVSDGDMTPSPHGQVHPYLTRLDVRNFGPIRRGSLELDADMTFVFGPQNSGKTYLATLAYLLSRQIQPMLGIGLTTALVEALQSEGLTGTISEEVIVDLATRKSSEIEGAFSRSPFLRGFVSSSLGPVYLVERLSDLIYQGQDRSEIDAEYSIGQTRAFTLRITITQSGVATTTVSFGQGFPANFLRAVHPQLSVMGPGGGWSSSQPGLTSGGTRYIPVERLVLLPVFYPYMNLILSIYRGLAQPSGLAINIPYQTPRFRQTVLDYVQEVNNALSAGPQASRDFELLNVGQLQVRVPQLLFKDSKRKVVTQISSAGSGVAQFAGIVLVAERTPQADSLFVEEPELNLHADAQLRAADYLAGLSHTSRVFVTTHSHYVATQLCLLFAKGKIRSLRGYYIDPDTDSVDPVLIDRRTGGFAVPKSIEKALEAIGNLALELDNEP